VNTKKCRTQTTLLPYFFKFDKMSVQLMKEFKMGELLIPIVWGYIPDVTFPGYFPDGLFDRLSQVFKDFLILKFLNKF